MSKGLKSCYFLVSGFPFVANESLKQENKVKTGES